MLHRSHMSRSSTFAQRLFAIFILSVFFSGFASCSFVGSFEEDKAHKYGGPYGGVTYLFNEPNKIEEPGFNRVYRAPFVLADLAGSFTLDTLILPVTIFQEKPGRPAETGSVTQGEASPEEVSTGRNTLWGVTRFAIWILLELSRIYVDVCGVGRHTSGFCVGFTREFGVETCRAARGGAEQVLPIAKLFR